MTVPHKLLKRRNWLEAYIEVFETLLFGHAGGNSAVCPELAELWLPNYMSEVVNIGIMRGGIRDNVPRAMSEALACYRFCPKMKKSSSRARFICAPGSEESKRKRKFPALQENLHIF